MGSLTSCYRPYDHEGLRARSDRVGQPFIRRLMGEILIAGEEPHERPPALRSVIADRAAQHRIPDLEGVEDRALRHCTLHLEPRLSVDARQRPQMRGEHDSYQGSVWTSTDRTAGRSRTIGAQESPPSFDA